MKCSACKKQFAPGLFEQHACVKQAQQSPQEERRMRLLMSGGWDGVKRTRAEALAKLGELK